MRQTCHCHEPVSRKVPIVFIREIGEEFLPVVYMHVTF